MEKSIYVLLSCCAWMALCLSSAYATLGAEPTCSLYQNCGLKCNHTLDYDTAIIMGLEINTHSPDAALAFRQNMKAAVEIMKQHDGVKSDDIGFFHATLQYYCCYSATEYAQIAWIIENIKWQPFNISFGQAICNFDDIEKKGNSSISFVVLMDDESQKQMAAFVAMIEDTIESQGIPIHKRRSAQEPFHSTIGVVKSGAYPVDTVIDQINSAIPDFSPQPITISDFWMLIPPVYFHSS